MLVIRLFRVGKKNQPIFKIVVAEKSQSSRAGRFVEEVGFYNPLTKEKILKADRLKYWIGVGAIASDTVHNLLISEKVIEGAKRKIAIKKSKKEKPGLTEEK
jgi:small subunit ribosomal protein S16